MRRVLIAILLLAGVVVHAQTPTAEQMAIFQNLPPDQQRAILEQMQRGSTSTQPTMPTPLEFPQSVLPRDVRTPALFWAARRDPAYCGGRLDRHRDPGAQVPAHPDARTADHAHARSRKPEVGQPTPVPGAVPPAPTPPTYPPSSLEAPEPIERTIEEQAKLDLYVARVQRGNPYRLDATGRLSLPELAPIPLAGLTADEAAKRLDSDSAMRDFELRVTLLPLEPIDVDALQPFGYDLFAGSPTTFAPGDGRAGAG